MRKWVKEVFLDGELAKLRANADFEFRRPRQDVKKEIISIKTTDNTEMFDLWVYQPTSATGGSTSRPAVLMFHGGGWIHGNPGGDESKQLIESHGDACLTTSRRRRDLCLGT